ASASIPMRSPATSLAGTDGSSALSIDSPAVRSSATAASNADFTSGSPTFDQSSGTSAALSDFHGRPLPRPPSTGAVADDGSRGSAPAIVARIVRQSQTERASGPTLSNVYAPTMPPARETRPYVGRMPVRPQNADGQRIDPHVSVPRANVASPAATAAPE